MVIPSIFGASLISSVVSNPSADAVLLSDVLPVSAASDVLSVSAELPFAVFSDADVLSDWLSETLDADVLVEDAEVLSAEDVLLPVDAVLPQAVRDIAAARKRAAHFFNFLSFFPVIEIPFPYFTMSGKKKAAAIRQQPFVVFVLQLL